MSMMTAAIAANRFGLGAKPGDLASIKSDPQGWLLAQLDGAQADPAPIAALPSTADDFQAFGRWAIQYAAQSADRNVPPFVLNRLRRQVPAVLKDKNGAQLGAEESVYATFKDRYRTAVRARFDAAVQSETPFRERLVHFWSNHFVVSSKKISAFPMPPSYERDVARSHVTGRFLDMLMASSKHPAMLHYLDNSYSVGPNSRWGKNPSEAPTLPVIGRMEGLNENLAREILELHTVGVNGGYSQTDVRNFAKVITGWMVKRGRSVFANRGLRGQSAAELFEFNPNAHEPGPQTVMGKVYAQDGVEQGEAVLLDLSRHPKTAEFIATKLVRYFIGDDPPPAAVKRVADAFLASDGDLKATATALVRSPEAWEEPLAKVKQPEEYLISGVRALGGPDMSGEELEQVLSQMGQPTYMQPGPDGWHDVAAEWIGPDPIWKRLEWANDASIETAQTELAPTRLGELVLGPVLSEPTKRVLEGSASPAQGFALLLVSPEFLRR